MGLFDFMKKNEKKPETAKKAAANPSKPVNPGALETFTIKVENDQIPFHDPSVDMDVKLLVRAEFYFNIKPDEEAVKVAAVQSFKDAFATIDGKVPASEFTKNINPLKKAMRESMVAQGFEVYSVMINRMSYNKEYKEIINGIKKL